MPILAVVLLGIALVVAVLRSVSGPDGSAHTDAAGVTATETADPTTTPTATAPAGTATTAPPTPAPVATPTASAASPDPFPDLAPVDLDLTEELPPSENQVRVAGRVDALVASPGFAREGTALGIALRDDRGRDVYDLAATTPLLPASTSKILTAAAILGVYDLDHRFETLVRGAIDGDGVVSGDLFLVGGGDPTLTTGDYRTHVFPSRPASSLETLADRVVAAGVRVVRGGVVGDASLLVADGQPRGWKDGYLADLDGRIVSALTVDGGIDLTAELPEDGGPVQLTMSAHPDPAARTAERFTQLLRERGVIITRDHRTIRAPSPERDVLAVETSPPLREILTFMLRRSDNHLADSLFRLLAARPLGGGTWDASSARMEAFLTRLGLDTTGIVVRDGSGLSRDTRVTADALAELDAVMWASEPSWGALQSEMGRTGTLRRRLRGTLAEGRAFGKTGTLDDVKSVTLTIIGFDGTPRWHLSVVDNDQPDQFVARVLADEIALLLLEDEGGCTRVLRDEPPAATAPPIVLPYDLTCPAGIGVLPVPLPPADASTPPPSEGATP